MDLKTHATTSCFNFSDVGNCIILNFPPPPPPPLVSVFLPQWFQTHVDDHRGQARGVDSRKRCYIELWQNKFLGLVST
jgi:hypothetical protein